jgi:hypothetical protein
MHARGSGSRPGKQAWFSVISPFGPPVSFPYGPEALYSLNWPMMITPKSFHTSVR